MISYDRQFFNVKNLLRSAVIFLVFLPFFVFAQSSQEKITSFDTTIQVLESGDIHVTEKITYDFGNQKHHGIFRDIPLGISPGSLRSIQIENINVTDELGDRYQFEDNIDIMRDWAVQGYVPSGPVEMRIGDPNITITGQHTYIIEYDVYGAIGFFDDFNEIYWNTTGNEWNVEIERASATVILPGEFTSDELRLASYCGAYGESNLCGDPVVTHTDGTTHVIFNNNYGVLYAYSGMTIGAGFPKDVVEFSLGEHIASIVTDIDILSSGNVHVVDTITYVSDPGRSLYGKFPYMINLGGEKEGGVRSPSVSDIKVYENGNLVHFDSRDMLSHGLVEIDIDLNKTQHVYVISYILSDVLNFSDTYDSFQEAFIDPTWRIPVQVVQKNITIPAIVHAQDIQAGMICEDGEEKILCGNTQIVTTGDSTVITVDSLGVDYFLPETRANFAVLFPRGVIDQPELLWYEKSSTLRFIAVACIAIIVFYFIRWVLLKFIPEFRRRKRSIVPQYEPPQDLSPSQVRYIKRNFMGDLGGTIVIEILYLASLGYIKISGTSPDMTPVQRFASWMLGLSPVKLRVAAGILLFTSFFWSRVFGVVTAALVLSPTYIKNLREIILKRLGWEDRIFIERTDKNIATLKSSRHVQLYYDVTSEKPVLFKELAHKGNYMAFDGFYNSMKREATLINNDSVKTYEDIDIFTSKKSNISNIMKLVLALWLFGFSVVAASLFDEPLKVFIFSCTAILLGVYVLHAGVINFLVKFIFKLQLDRMTPLRYNILGFYEYISLAEKRRIEFHHDPKKSFEIFSHLLPYAMAFGLERKWTKAFSGILNTSPQWYQVDGVFSSQKMATTFSSMHAISSLVVNAGRPAPVRSSGSSGSSSSRSSSSSGSSGGGSSGGGGGGGGGGSW